MLFFRTDTDISLDRQRMRQDLKAATTGGANYVTSMYDFFEIARTIGSKPAEESLKVVPEDLILDRTCSPTELGISNRGEYPRWLQRKDGLPSPAPANILRSQLKTFADRRPFRVAIINGFGTGIGDCLVGLTAWRRARDEMVRAGIDKVDVEMWVRPRGFCNARDVCAIDTAVDRVEVLPMPMERFEERDAFFDLSGLLDRSGIDTMPFVDFLLGLLGLDPDSVSGDRKRNHIEILPDVVQQVRDEVHGRTNRYVLLHPLSSNVLRNMPMETLREVARLTVEHTACDIATVVPAPKVHQRQLDLSYVSRHGYPYFCALISQAAGLISVDTSAYHIADAFDVPTVAIFSSIRPRLRVAYYPFVQGIMLPGIETSSLMGRHRARNAADADAVFEHWQRLDIVGLVERLANLMKRA